MAIITQRIRVRRAGLSSFLEKFDSIVSKADRVTEKIANESLARLVLSTPIRYTGTVRAGWVKRKLGTMIYVLANPLKVMRWLEGGTRAHGPVTARALFLPLNQKATEAGPREVMEANARARAEGQWRNYGARAAGGTGRAVRLPYVQGVDFLWVKRVKGIKARHIARDEQKKAARALRSALVKLLKAELK
jgi:hypothetical protein